MEAAVLPSRNDLALAGGHANSSNPSARGLVGADAAGRSGARAPLLHRFEAEVRSPELPAGPLQTRASRSTLSALANLLGRSEPFSILLTLWYGRNEGASAATEGSNRRG